MHNLLLFIPLITCLFLLILFNKKVVWWEYILVIIPSILITYIGTLIMISSNCSDTEYMSYGVNKIRYYEPWDEWITQTCTREVPCGTDSDGNTIYTTETYDCSHKVYHEEQYTIVLNDPDNIEQEIKKEYYNKILNRWTIPNKNINKFINMNRDFYTLDGDMYEISWNGNIDDYFCYTLEGSYKNKVKASKSIFKFEDISEDDIVNNSLYKNYNPVVKHPDLGPMLGWFSSGSVYQQKVFGSNNKELNKQFDYINGFLGPKYQIQVYLLIYNGLKHSKDVAFLQQSLWEGGNKNEMILCLGVDSLNKKITWSKVFSWSETPELEIRTESFFNTCDSLSINDTFIPYRHFITNNIKYWKRKEFKDFEYLAPELTMSQLKLLFVLNIFWCIGISIFVILNGFIYSKDFKVINKNEENKNYYRF